MPRPPEYRSAQEDFYETTRPVWRWYVFIFKAKMIYAAFVIGLTLIAWIIVLASPNNSVTHGSLPRDEFTERYAAQKKAQERLLASIEGDPRRIPMRTDLSFGERKRCERTWLTPSARTFQKPDGSFEGFPNEINVNTPHPPECY